MAVTEYKPKSNLGCRYSYDKLENVVYIVSKEHVKNVHIDGGEAYITDLTEVPLRLDGFNIQFSEESSLDERYKFTKQVTFSLHGYVPHTVFNSKYYVILKSKDGTKWMVNVDFPSKVTYTFNLNGSQYQTDFTFSSVSNFPTLRLASDIDEGVSPCKELRTYGIDSLRMLENEYCRLDSVSGIVYTYGKDFVDVEYLGNSCSLQESFDGDKVTTTIQFNIAFDAYKSSWYYNLLEFLQNHYSAIIRPKGANNTFFSGFNFGLEPSFNIATTSNNGSSDIITVTLVETSSQGSENASDWSEQEDTDTRWVYIKKIDDILGYECVGLGVAKYLLQQEIGKNGIPTGNYKCLEGYESQFSTLRIVGTFSSEVTFTNPDCKQAACDVSTNIPNTITYSAATCFTYSYSASCDWEVSGLASYMTVTPSSGVAGSAYTLSVCNTKTPTTNESSTFTITSGDNVKVVNVNLITDGGILNPSSITINCLSQNVSFNFNPNCRITVTSIDSRLTYNITNSQLIVNVPRNYSVESGITWSIGVKDCQNRTQTVTIIQDKTYETWVDTTGYICSGTTSYVKQQRYTGTTSSSINVPTSEYRAGAVIEVEDSRCGGGDTRWVTSSAYTCVDGDKWSFEEEYKRPQGGTWQKTGNTRLKSMVESASSFCQQEVEYKWVLTEQWQCYGGEIPSIFKFKAEYSDSTSYSAACDSSTELTTATTRAHSTSYTAMTSAEIGCVTSIGNAAFSGCSNLTSIDIPNSVTSIGIAAFMDCTSLQSIDIPNSLTSISAWTFRNCSDLTSIEIPNSVTSIGDLAFETCTSLTSCTIGSGVTSIGSSVFVYCTGLTSIDIPDSVTSIGNYTFSVCQGLTSCTIGSGVTSIGQSAFIGCIGLTSIDIPSGITRIGDGTFRDCSSLSSIDIPSGVTAIGSSAFYKCTSLTSIIIPSGVTSFGSTAFAGCSSLTSINIPSGITEIYDYTFYECTSLSSIIIPSGVTAIGYGAFRYSSGLTSITCLATTPPTLAHANALDSTNNCPIYVPSASVDTYKAASGWSDYASRIQAIP